jgi:hypothetical protein
MKTITIGFSRANTFFPIFSWIIMAVQKTNYSHVYLKYQDEYLGQTMYYQASHTLVNSMSATVFLAQELPVQEFNFQVSDATFLKTMQFAANQAGKPYGIMEICGLALVEAAALFGIKIQNPVKDEGTTFICDQLIAAMLNECENIQLPMPINNMDPKDVFALVSTLPTQL